MHYYNLIFKNTRVSSLGGKAFPILKCASITALPVKVTPEYRLWHRKPEFESSSLAV